DAGIRAVLRDILEDIGYEVDEAANGEVALRRLRKSNRCYIVLLDLWMPQLDGLEVLAAVAADGDLRRRHAFVLVSADPRAETRVNERLVGTLHVPIIAKPFDVDELLGVVEAQARSLAYTPQGEQEEWDDTGNVGQG